jgi:hypothetical protein
MSVQGFSYISLRLFPGDGTEEGKGDGGGCGEGLKKLCLGDVRELFRYGQAKVLYICEVRDRKTTTLCVLPYLVK